MLSKEELVDLVINDKNTFNTEIKNIPNADMSEVDFSNVNLSGIEFIDVDLNSSSMVNQVQ